ncbi:MAG: DUF1552 domain-containing protein [Pirellulaceae bacterium]
MNRREYLKFAIGAAVACSIMGQSRLIAGERPKEGGKQKKRFIIVFSPNGVVPENFWPTEQGTEFSLPRILEPLAPWKDQLLVLNGVDNKCRGDGDDHMRGMSCLLTGIELYPGNIMGGGNTPAGWPRGPSIDQVIKEHLQQYESTRTRFGSLEFGVLVPDRADVWTRWVYSAANRPVTPISDPRRMFQKLYGNMAEQKHISTAMDLASSDLTKLLGQHADPSFQKRLRDHLDCLQQNQKQIEHQKSENLVVPPEIKVDVELSAENLPEISLTQQRLLVEALRTDQARIATLQYDRSVGNLTLKCAGVEEGHHTLSHDPDNKTESVEKLTKINTWYCQQIADLVQLLATTPEVDGSGVLLDNTTILWTNELGKGNSHSLQNIPMVFVGNGLGFKMGRSLKFDHLAHNRVWLSVAHSMGVELETFGNPKFCAGGIVPQLYE